MAVTAVLLLTRAVGFLAVAATIAGAVWLLARIAARALRKVSEYHDVERLDEAEILARKYDRESRGKR